MKNQLTDIGTGLKTEELSLLKKNFIKKVDSNLALAFGVFLNQVKSIFFVLLLISAILSYFLGNTTDSIIFIVLNLLNVFIGFFQEFRAGKAGLMLSRLIAHSVTVLRDGRLQEIDSGDLVMGDIVHLVPGDVVASDMFLRSTEGVFVDESIRTGESAPRPCNESDELFAGTSISAGTALAQVSAVGEENSLMLYSKKLAEVKKENNFNIFIKKISIQILLATLICLALIAVVSVFIQGKYDGASYLLFAISMLVGVVPESLSLIITLMLTREAMILIKEGVIVKNLAALQQLGSIIYLLTDKTGTLTENTVRLAESRNVARLSYMALRISESEYERSPMDKAFDQAVMYIGEQTGGGADDDNLKKGSKEKPVITPFSNKKGYAMFDFGDMVIIRGQFDAVFDQSLFVDESLALSLKKEYIAHESKGLRVLAYATCPAAASVSSAQASAGAYSGASATVNTNTNAETNSNSNRGANHTTYTFAGYVVFEDPLKADASESFIATEKLGIKVKVLTGDSPLVARYVVSRLDHKLDEKNVYVLGERAAAALTQEEIETDRVYARCTPDQKLELIDRHIALGAVGFMGEGINDALALKRADVGIAVMNASDVARQSADILLTENSLNPVITAIGLSRRAYAHISTYLLCTLTGNVGTLISLTAVAMFWTDLPMLPIQILLNNLLTDVPLILLVTDHLAKSEYDKPVNHSAQEFFKTMFAFAFISSIFDMMYFFLFKDQSLEVLRTGWFIFSVCCELVLVFSLRSKLSIFKAPRMSLLLFVGMVLSIGAALACMYIPIFGAKLSLVALNSTAMTTIFSLVLVYVLVNEVYKRLISRR